MAKEKDTPANEFKRVLTVAMKTIAEDPELTVAFGNEQASLAGNRAWNTEKPLSPRPR